MSDASNRPVPVEATSARSATGALLIGAGGVLLGVSPALPWVHVTLVGDLTLFQLLKLTSHPAAFGWGAIVAGSLLAVTALALRRSTGSLRLFSFLLACVVALVGGPGTARLVNIVSGSNGFLGVGAGVIVVALGEILLVAGAIAPSSYVAAALTTVGNPPVAETPSVAQTPGVTTATNTGMEDRGEKPSPRVPVTETGLAMEPSTHLGPTPAHPGIGHRSRRILILVIIAIALLAGAGAAGYLIRHRGTTTTPRLPTTSPTMTSSTTTSTTVPSWATVYKNDVSGVVRIDSTTCTGGGIGSGFLLSPTLVVTAAHVVDGSVVIGLTDGTHTVVGHVIGINPTTDVALVQAASTLTGHSFALAAKQAPVGTTIGVIGYPEGGPITLTTGVVGGLDRTIEINGQPRTGLLQTDAPLNPGNSGGPLLLPDGEVVGIADAALVGAENVGYAVPSTAAVPLVTAWEAASSPPSPPACQNPIGPSSAFGGVAGGGSGSVATAITATLATYFDSIDTGDYATAYAQLGPTLQARQSESNFAAGVATSYNYNVNVQSINEPSPGTAVVNLSFTSLQSPPQGPHGDSCDNWYLTYTMMQIAGSWVIQSSTGQGGAVPYQSC